MLRSVTHCCLLSLGALLFSLSLVDSRFLHRDLQLEALKTGILENLGMDKPPQFKGPVSYQELRRVFRQYREMMQLHRSNFSQEVEPWLGQQYSTVLHPTTVAHLRRHVGRHARVDSQVQWYRAVFRTSSEDINLSALAHAELKLYRQQQDNSPPGQSHNRQTIFVKIHEKGHITPSFFRHMHTYKSSNVQNVTLDVKVQVERWLMKSGVNPLIVDVGIATGEKGSLESVPKIMLELSQKGGKSRKPRSATEDGNDIEGKCRRKSLDVSFKEIGWSDWVIAPTSYTMYFCDGTCPHNYKPASMHTQVKARVHQMTKGATPLPCCVPAAYEPMILMHYDSQGKLKVTPFNDLIVSKCHCA
ncbi:bone morphogenetic protein 8A [Chanos chanos]|uniref:Bone morphogenetic protein 8A n=1 Tax=Chanos chanos TaxID=29144 RepID=A0A6J2VEA1_CHACN|nr:bone morphogenetic protein 8A-like [Chanos chanos]